MSKRILVVEDQADNRQIIRDMLAPTDYEISRRSRSVTFISIPAPKGWLALSMPASETGVPKNDSEEKVLQKLATSDKTTIVVERLTDGKMRFTSGSWDGEKVILRDQVLGVSKVDWPFAGRAKAAAPRGGQSAD
jgi:hypothetical protein